MFCIPRLYAAVTGTASTGEPTRLVELLLGQQRTDVSPCTHVLEKSGLSVLHAACAQGLSDVVKLLLNGQWSGLEDAAPKSGIFKGWTPLMASCANAGDLRTIQILIDKKAVIDATFKGKGNLNGSTALIIAANRGHEDAVSCLLRANASIHIKNKKKRTALDEAAKRGHTSLVTMLEDHLPLTRIKSRISSVKGKLQRQTSTVKPL